MVQRDLLIIKLNVAKEAKKVIAAYVTEYNGRQLDSGIGYVTPLSKLNGENAAYCKT